MSAKFKATRGMGPEHFHVLLRSLVRCMLENNALDAIVAGNWAKYPSHLPGFLITDFPDV